ncbi:hypothetical protein B0A49_02285 [Cryomyces minteri]|uniref:Uncharacterized protein n=1 Tax=Cryomyces minteri TaxID=331657 RepID=A0A4U0XM18_9PEZI|nr:hypothetical protein B0A49_02285 [Cryomyces minteri]
MAVCDAAVPLYYGAVASSIGCSVFVADVGNLCECPPIEAITTGYGPYQEYFFILDEYKIETLRSRSSDTNTVYIGVDLNDVDSNGARLTKPPGDHGSGFTSKPGMQINFMAQSTDRVTLWMLIYNGDTSPESLKKLKHESETLSFAGIAQLASATGTALLDMFGSLFGTQGTLQNALPSNLWHTIFPNCDGYVLQEILTYKDASSLYDDIQKAGGQVSLLHVYG